MRESGGGWCWIIMMLGLAAGACGALVDDLPWFPPAIEKNKLNKAIQPNVPGPGKRGGTHDAKLVLVSANVTSLTTNQHLFKEFKEDVVAIQEVNSNEFECKPLRKAFKRHGKYFMVRHQTGHQRSRR